MLQNIDEKTLFKVSSSAGIAGIGSFAGLIFGYLSTLFMTRYLGPDLYGVYVLASTIIAFALIFSRVGLDKGLLRFVSLYKGIGDSPRIKGVIYFSTKVALSFSIAISIILFVVAPLLARNIFNDYRLVNVIRPLLMTLPFLSLMALLLATIQGFQRISLRVRIEKLFKPALTLIVLIALLHFGLKLEAIIFASIFSAVSGFIISIYYLQRLFPFFGKDIKKISEPAEYTRFSIPLLFDNLLVFVVEWIDIMMIGYFLQSVQVGIYGAVVKVSILGLIVLRAFNMIFAPIVSEYFGLREVDKIENLFKIITKWIFTLSYPVFLSMILFAKPIMSIFGPAFVSGAPCLVVLCLARIIDSSVGASGIVILMSGRSKINLINSLFLSILCIGLNYLLIPKYSILGAAVATGVSVAIINLLRLIEVYFLFRFHPYKLSFIKPILSGLIALILTSLAIKFFEVQNPIHLALVALLFISLYFLSLKAMQLEKEETIILKKIREIIVIPSPGWLK